MKRKKATETNITKRWEQGIPHHPESEKLYEEIAKTDWLYGNDSFCFKSGGDGDNGEQLMYLLDIIFEQREISNETKKSD